MRRVLIYIKHCLSHWGKAMSMTFMRQAIAQYLHFMVFFHILSHNQALYGATLCYFYHSSREFMVPMIRRIIKGLCYWWNSRDQQGMVGVWDMHKCNLNWRSRNKLFMKFPCVKLSTYWKAVSDIQYYFMHWWKENPINRKINLFWYSAMNFDLAER